MHLCEAIDFELIGTNTYRRGWSRDNAITVPVQQLRLQTDCQTCTSLSESIDYRFHHESTWAKQYGVRSLYPKRKPAKEEIRDAKVTFEITEWVVRNWSFGFDGTTLRNVLMATIRAGDQWANIFWQRSGSGGRVPVSSKPKAEYGDNEITFSSTSSWNNGEEIPQYWQWEENPNPVAASLQPTLGRFRQLVLDFEMIRRWIDLCDHGHDLCNLKHVPVIQRLRLISIRDMCVKEMRGTDIPPFATLSYVWGSALFQRLTRAVLPNLAEAEGLKTIRLPATIEDAISICEKLRIGHLWVDSLCIIQDDEYDMIEFIDKMELIYSQSILTIVAASGLDADSRIPGVNSVPRTLEQRPIEARGVPLIDCVDNTMLQFNTKFEEPSWISGTPWAQRAWTFQEALISHRVLFFTAEQVYWSCRQGLLSEDTVEYFVSNNESTTTVEEPNNDEFSFSEYNNIALTFSTRKLTFEADIARAYLGTQNHLQKRWKEQRFSWGLPHGAFGTMLMWEWGYLKQRRLRRGMHSIQQANGIILEIPFPSWSWLSWTNDGRLKDYYGDEDGAHSPSFFVYDFSDNLVSVRDAAHWSYPFRWLGSLLATAPTNLQHSSAESVVISKKLLTEPVLSPSLRSSALVFFTEVATVRYDPSVASNVGPYSDTPDDLQFTSHQYPFSIKVEDKFHRVFEEQQIGVAAEHTTLHEIELVAVFAGQMTKPRHHRGQYRLYCWPVVKLQDGRRIRTSYMATIIYLSLWRSLPRRAWELVVLT